MKSLYQQYSCPEKKKKDNHSLLKHTKLLFGKWRREGLLLCNNRLGKLFSLKQTRELWRLKHVEGDHKAPCLFTNQMTAA